MSFFSIKKYNWLKIGLGIILSLITLLVLFYSSIYFGLWGKLPSKKDLSDLKQQQATQILDINNDLLGKVYRLDRQNITYKQFPKHLIDALIATEDARFYEHDGIDSRSLFRVFFKTILQADKSSGGGSTITLQLAKNLYGRKDYGYLSIVVNKLRESIVASRIEAIYSKKEILTLYLNTVPFSDNTYGIESAAQKFFNKTTQDLNLAEAATLIGSLKANHSYNPRLFPERSQLRRDVVITQMLKYNYITEKEAEEAMQNNILLDYQYYNPNQGIAPYFRAQVIKEANKIIAENKLVKANGKGYEIYTDGLKIHTTLDINLQQHAEAAVKKHLTKLQKAFEEAYGNLAPWKKDSTLIYKTLKTTAYYKHLKQQKLSEQQLQDSLKLKRKIKVFNWEGNQTKNLSVLDSITHYLKFLNTGMLSVEPQTGGIRAYVGGINYNFFKYDHITQSKRQVGSTFKPIVYTTAIENGMPACTYYSNKAITYTDVDNWKPKNASKNNPSDLNYSLETALSNSINTIAVKVMHDTGIEKTIDMAKAMGITSSIEPVPAIALGVSSFSVLELATAYTTFVNQSIPSQAYFITKIEDKNGKLLYQHKPKTSTQKAYSDHTRQIMLEMMKETVNSGTARRLRSTFNLPNAIAGKTGTTQDNKDGWFVGITPNLVNIIWVGNDQQIGFKTTRQGQGAKSALPIFGYFMQALNNNPDFNFITKANFENSTPKVLEELSCPPTKEDGFLKRIFGKKEDEEQSFKKEEKKKKGFFDFLKKKK